MILDQRLSRFFTIIAIGLLAAGCPEGEEDPEPDAGEQADVGEDTGSDAGMDAERDAADTADDTADDTGGETAATCVVDGVAPRTFSIEAADSAFSMTMRCDGEPSAEQFAGPLAFRRDRAQSGALELTVDGVQCEPSGEYQSCTVGLSGLAQPTGTYDEVVGPEDLVIEDASGQQFDARVHWHLPTGQLEGLQRERDMLQLPAGYAERGLDFAVKQTASGRLMTGAMENAAGDAVEIFSVSPNGDVSVDVTVDVDPATLAASNLAMMEIGGRFGAFWWGFDATSGQFAGLQAIYDDSGGFVQSLQLEATSYTGPAVAEVLGWEAGTTEVGGQIWMSARVLARTDRGTVAVIRLGDASGADIVSLETELDALGSVAGANLTSEISGMLTSEAGGGDLDANRGNAWAVDQSGKVSLVPLSGSAGASTATLTSVQWPYELEVAKASESRIVVRATSATAGAEPQVYTLGTQDGILTTSVCHLSPAPGVDLSGPASFIDASDGARHVHLGRLSGNGTPMIVEWDLSGSCADTRPPVTMIQPAVAETPSSGTGAATGDCAFTVVGADGSVQLVKADALRSTCTDAEACALPITESTNDGWRVNIVPGDSQTTWAVDKYGDILIDGVPLVFDLTAPPIIFDAPGATAQNDAAMILAGIDHESATHAVWTVDTTGKLSQPGLLDLDTGDPSTGVVLTAAAGEDKGDDEQARDMTLTIATVIIDFGDDGSDSSNERGAGTFSVTTGQLAAAIGTADPVSFTTGGPEFDISASATQTAVLAPAGAIVPEFSYQGGSDRANALIELSAEQAARPLVLIYTNEGLKMRSSGDGDPPLDVLLDQNEPVSNDNPLYVEGDTVPETTIAGDSSRQNGPHFRTFNGLRYDHYSIGTHSNSSSDESGSSSSFGVSVVQAAFPSELAGEDVLILDSGDLNADGLDDLVVTTRGASGSTVVFSNGMGGFLPGVMTLSGGPTVEWPSGANASTSGNGKGTSKSASIALQNIHLELL
jgi:hypothetical protein